RRPDGAGRGPVPRAPAAARPQARGADHRDPAADDRTVAGHRSGGRRRRHAQAGDGAGGRRRDRPGGHGAGRGGAPDRPCVRHEPEAAVAYDALLGLVSARHGRTLFSTDGSSVDEQVAALLARRWVGVAESCTGGLMVARLTERAGASEYMAGGVVSYSDEAKTELLGVDPAVIARHGAVSPATAAAMAAGALRRFEADTAIAITGDRKSTRLNSSH